MFRTVYESRIELVKDFQGQTPDFPICMYFGYQNSICDFSAVSRWILIIFEYEDTDFALGLRVGVVNVLGHIFSVHDPLAQHWNPK